MDQNPMLTSPIIPPNIVPLIQRASHNNLPVLIFGEKGVGKQSVAKAICQFGEWKHHRFCKIDCRMLKEGTLFSQLAHLFKEIRFETPATVFLKEIGYLGHGDQVKLLEVIEEGVFDYNGERRSARKLRWIVSSSEDLMEKAKQRSFSLDLYDCLNALPIYLPPLRDRFKEIPTIVRHLVAEHVTRLNLRTKGVSQSVYSLLQSYWWPGNLKELNGIILRSAISSDGEKVMEKDLCFVSKDENNLFFNFLERGKLKGSADKKNIPSGEESPFHLISFLVEVVQRIREPMVSIKTFTRLLENKFSDGEFRQSFYRVVTGDIEKIDLLLNGLLDYIKANTLFEKSNTIHRILEEVLKRHEALFGEKQIKILKKLQKDLPETTVHEEQLRYIFHSLIEYFFSSLPPHGIMGFLTKLLEEEKQTKLEEVASHKRGEWIEILMIFTAIKRTVDKYEAILGIPSIQSEQSQELELKLIHEILKKNNGRMTIEVNKKKPRTLISVWLPVERRKVIYYPRGNTWTGESDYVRT